jgi:hypothetical protein
VKSQTGACEVRFDTAVVPKAEPTDERLLKKQLVTLTLTARDQLAYSITCNGRRPRK